MNNNTRYFKYQLFRRWYIPVVMSIIMILASFNVVYKNSHRDYFSLSLNILSIWMFIFAMVMPAICYFSFVNKRNLDTIYSLPISRKALFITNYLVGLVYLLVPYAVGSLISAIDIAATASDAHWAGGYFAMYFILELFFSVALYSFMTMAFVIGNSEGEAGLLELAYCVVPWMVLYFIALLINKVAYDGKWDFSDKPIVRFLTSTSLSGISSNVAEASQYKITHANYMAGEKMFYPVYISFIVFGVLCAFAACYIFSHKKAEHIGEASKSPLGLSMLIPAGYLSVMLMVGTPIIKVSMLPTMYFLYVIQNRSAKIGKVNLIVLIVVAMVALMPLPALL